MSKPYSLALILAAAACSNNPESIATKVENSTNISQERQTGKLDISEEKSKRDLINIYESQLVGAQITYLIDEGYNVQVPRSLSEGDSICLMDGKLWFRPNEDLNSLYPLRGVLSEIGKRPFRIDIREVINGNEIGCYVAGALGGGPARGYIAPPIRKDSQKKVSGAIKI
ncbi:MAG TPA: hypothetical protein VJI68_01395 [Candidatus Nanoarchaeia archaeon]|nr:hypothetical protein [Candidatus Nanoarchaeia archaeon]